VVVEDLHWIDAETQALLDRLVEALPAARLLLLVNYRPEYVHGWGNRRSYSQMRIEPLATEGAEDLLRALLGPAEALARLKRHLIEHTGGNPFFLEECVRSLVETGVLIGHRGEYRLTQSLPDVRVPATVQAILAARIDRLEPDEKRVLQTAAVIGKDVPFALLRAISELAGDTLEVVLSRLQATELLDSVSLSPEREYTFTHAVTHEVAYGSLLLARRRTLHARVVEAIEWVYASRLSEQAELLAHHALRGELWEHVVTYSRRAGGKAAGHSATQQAVIYFDQALAALGHLPESLVTLGQTLDTHLELQPCLHVLGVADRYLDNLRAAELVAERLGDHNKLARVYTFETACRYFLGEYDRSIHAGQRALAIAANLDDGELLAAGHLQVAYPYLARGDLREATVHLSAVAAYFEGDRIGNRHGLTSFPAVSSRAELAACLADLGEFPEATAYALQAVQSAETVQHAYSLAFACSGAGYTYLRKGELAEAVSHLERARSLCQIWDFRRLAPIILSRLGLAFTLLGHSEAGLRLLQESAAHDTVRRAVSQSAVRAAWLSEAYLHAGRPQDALQCAQESVRLATDRGESGHRAWALRLLGEIAARHDPPDLEEATSRYREALSLAEELGMRPLQAYCHLSLGRLYRRIGGEYDARAELSTAISMLSAMKMARWLPGAEAELAQVHAVRSSGRVD
jgi:predicted ATPase